jgi:TadE-like protein
MREGRAPSGCYGKRLTAGGTNIMVCIPRNALYATLGRLWRDRHGQAIVEFAIALPFLVMVSIGTFALGVVIDRHLTVTQLVRNAGNMYGRGVDFTLTQNKELLLKAADGMEMTVAGGQGVIYLSTVILSQDGDNEGDPVVSERIVISNASLYDSAVAMPTTILPNGDVVDYDNDPSAVASLPPGVELFNNERIFVAEVFHNPRNLSFEGIFVPTNLYSAAFF